MWYLYIVRCQDKSLYTGITTNIPRRMEQHRTGKGSKLLRAKLPIKLVYRERLSSHSKALIREAQIKKMARKDKVKLVNKKSRIR